jgi:hypothetical protein
MSLLTSELDQAPPLWLVSFYSTEQVIDIPPDFIDIPLDIPQEDSFVTHGVLFLFECSSAMLCEDGSHSGARRDFGVKIHIHRSPMQYKCLFLLVSSVE